MKKLWKKLSAPLPHQKEEGVALVIALLILVMLTVVGLVAIISSSTETAIAINAKGSTQALYLAESGVARVAEWFRLPDTFTTTGHFNAPSPYTWTGAATQFFLERQQQNSSYLGTDGVSQYHGTTAQPDLLFKSSTSNDNTLLNDPSSGFFKDIAAYGDITELMVYAPTSGSGNICTIRVTAQSKLGGQRTIEQELSPNPFSGLNSAMQSGLGASWNGNGTIHWGDVLVQGNASLQLNKTPYPYQNGGLTSDFDRWANISVSGTFSGQAAGNPTPYATTCTPNPDGGSYPQVCRTNLKQQQTVQIVKWDYQTTKTTALNYSSYYVFDGSNVRQGGLSGPVVNLNTLMTTNNGFVFIDTPNQKDPAAGGTPFTLSQTGTPGGLIQGAFYVAGNLSFGGLGGATSENVKAPPNPDNCNTSLGPCPTAGERESANLGLHIKGVLYSTGTMNFTGNPGIFGAVVAESGFGSGGTPDIWYDWDIRRRISNMIPTSKKIWREIRDTQR
jgi:hypothetical protein